MTTDDLVSTIRAVHAGKSHIPPAIAQRLAERMGTEELTPREFDVLEQIVHGLSNKEIASFLEISEATVKTHINSLLGKARRHRSHPGRYCRHSARHRSTGIPPKAKDNKVTMKRFSFLHLPAPLASTP